MTKNQEALKFMQDYLELERRVKILELQLEEEKKKSVYEEKIFMDIQQEIKLSYKL